MPRLTQLVNGKKKGMKAMSLYPFSEMGKLHIPAPESGQWTNLVLNSELKPSGGLFFLDPGLHEN